MGSDCLQGKVEFIGGMSGIVDESLELSDPTPDIHQLFVKFNAMFFEGELGGCEVKWSPRMTLYVSFLVSRFSLIALVVHLSLLLPTCELHIFPLRFRVIFSLSSFISR